MLVSLHAMCINKWFVQLKEQRDKYLQVTRPPLMYFRITDTVCETLSVDGIAHILFGQCRVFRQVAVGNKLDLDCCDYQVASTCLHSMLGAAAANSTHSC